MTKQTVRLEVRDGGFVAEVEIMSFQIPPEGLLWGQRTFFEHDTCGDVWVYREGLMHYIPTGAHVVATVSIPKDKLVTMTRPERPKKPGGSN
jgi:hypothetical protein